MGNEKKRLRVMTVEAAKHFSTGHSDDQSDGVWALLEETSRAKVVARELCGLCLGARNKDSGAQDVSLTV